MTAPDATCWTLIRAAAGGDTAARERFGRVYQPVVRAYLAARLADHHVDDAVQDVFVECFKTGGVLERAESHRPGGFRAFLIGVARNVARRIEDRRRPAQALPAELPADDTGPEEAFDRAWARALLREAAQVMKRKCDRNGEAACRRVELLRLRFQEARPIRDIATLWGVESAHLHHEYAVAREEFRKALGEVVAFHHPTATAGEVDRLCQELVRLVG